MASKESIVVDNIMSLLKKLDIELTEKMIDDLEQSMQMREKNTGVNNE